MGKRGKKRDVDREIRYWELLSQGIGPVEVCRLIGVSRGKGYRGRAEMGGVLYKKPAALTGRYLSVLGRQRIASVHDRGVSIREITATSGGHHRRSPGSCAAIPVIGMKGMNQPWLTFEQVRVQSGRRAAI